MKLYFPESHYHKFRPLVFPLLRPFLKDDSFDDAQRVEVYGVSEKDFEFTDSIVDADLVILTMAWNYYVKNGNIKVAIDFIQECATLDKKVLAVNAEDFGMRIPYFENLIILRYGGYKSKFSKNEYVFPPFIKDPLLTYFDRKTVIERPFSRKAKIGFCGLANSSLINASKEISKTSLRNLRFYLGISNQEPQELLSTSLLRSSILNDLEKSSEIDTNFIIRNKYRAGITANQSEHKTTIEFYDNLRDSDYVVCVRGAGNFSIRFYEALAMGRIPVFINTNCALPFDDKLDWKKHVVWVEYKERHKVVEKVLEFHRGLSERDFIDLQLANRKLWEEYLTLRGYFTKFITEDM